MKKFFILTALISLTIGTINAQSLNNPSEQPVQINDNVKCKMSVEDVLREQPFDIDHYKSESAHKIIAQLFAELSLIYDKIEVNNNINVTAHTNKIKQLLQSADNLEMNYEMFKADLDYVNTLK